MVTSFCYVVLLELLCGASSECLKIGKRVSFLQLCCCLLELQCSASSGCLKIGNVLLLFSCFDESFVSRLSVLLELLFSASSNCWVFDESLVSRPSALLELLCSASSGLFRDRKLCLLSFVVDFL